MDYKMDFCEYLLEYSREYEKNNPHRPLIICGDVNTAHKEIDLARPKENSTRSGFLPMEREWIDRFLASGFEDSFRLYNPEPENYTWWDMKTRARNRNIGWRIDYFLTSKALRERLKKAEILSEILGANHCPVILNLKA